MAEGLINAYFGKDYEAFSAGTHPGQINPLAIRVMKEIEIDISGQKSKSTDEFLGDRFDWVVTVCDFARESCPNFAGEKIIHQGFEDPAAVAGSEQEKLDVFRKSRDTIEDWLKKQFG